MTSKRSIQFATLAAALLLPLSAAPAQTTPAPAAAADFAAEDTRLIAFLDAEFAEFVKTQPQLATRLGLKDGADQWNDIGDSAAAAQVEWRKASVARMRAAFDRARQKERAPFEQPVRHAVKAHRPDARIEQHFPARTRRGIARDDGIQIGGQALWHCSPVSHLTPAMASAAGFRP